MMKMTDWDGQTEMKIACTGAVKSTVTTWVLQYKFVLAMIQGKRMTKCQTSSLE